jgi:hypothetical protein
VDYEALAKQYGGETSSAPVDYEALAKQYGGKTTVTTKQEDKLPPLMRTMTDLAYGGLNTAGNIGATILEGVNNINPYSVYRRMTGQDIPGPVVDRNVLRDATESLGADPNSLAYKTGGVAVGVAGTAGIPFSRFVPGSGAVGYATNVAKNALAGGAAAGLINPDEAATGALVGGAIPAVGTLVGGAVNKLNRGVIQPTINLLTGDAGAVRIARNFIGDTVGEANIPATIQAARSAKPQLAGYPITTPEAMVQPTVNLATGKTEQAMIPEGTAVSRIYDLIGKQPGGASTKAYQRTIDQKNVVDLAYAARKAAADPAYAAAFAPKAIDLSAGGPITSVDKLELAKILENPYIKEVMPDVQDIVKTFGYTAENDTTRILDAIKKGLDTKLKNSEGLAVSGMPSASKQTILAVTKVKNDLVNWISSHNDAYAKANAGFEAATKPINAMLERQALAKKPLQPTTIGSASDMTGDVTPQVANMLSRPVMLTNFILRNLGKRANPKVESAMMELMQDPSKYADVMSTLTPAGKSQLAQLLAAARNPLVVAATAP